MKKTYRLAFFAALFSSPALAHARDQTALVEHLKHDFGGYAIVLSLMIWAIVELRKDATHSNPSTTESRTPNPKRSEFLEKHPLLASVCKAMCRS